MSENKTKDNPGPARFFFNIMPTSIGVSAECIFWELFGLSMP
jgi:hypothetical protein